MVSLMVLKVIILKVLPSTHNGNFLYFKEFICEYKIRLDFQVSWHDYPPGEP